MTEKDVQDAVENIEEIVSKKHSFHQFLDISSKMGGGVVALSAAIVSGSMAITKFRAAYESIKKGV